MNEELRSANEEIQSSNEEMQSTNEELETAKEELQSINEELTTLNEELENRNQELAVVNSDLINLLSSVEIPILMLDGKMRIRRFNPEQGSFADWLRGIAANILRNLLRKRKRQAVQSLNGQLLATKETPDAAVAKDQAEQIAQALANLPERYEAALRAKYLDQQSVNQIAEAWNENPKAIESLLTRARQALREAFQGRELG